MQNVFILGFHLSVIILASLLVCLMLGCRHSLLRLSNNFTFFSSRMHIFKHSYLCIRTSRGTLPCDFVVNLYVWNCTAGTSYICWSLERNLLLYFPLNVPHYKILLCACCFNNLDSRVEICVTGEIRSVINLWLEDYCHFSHQKVNVSYRMYFELMESFGLVLCDVH